MAAVSAWAKPGAWALDSEENEAATAIDKPYSSSDSTAAATPAAAADFPSLSAAKDTKKKKKKTLALAEFSVAPEAKLFHPSSRSTVPDQTLVLPTGPRERSAEELLERPRGFGYSSSYGPRDGGRGERREPREPREPRDSGPSRADEADDWGSMKRSIAPERKDRGFFDSQQSRADESDSWISRKAVVPSGPPRSSGRFEMFREGSGVDSDTWGRKREEIGGRGDADTWGKKREESGGVGARPRLVLQPRSLTVVNGSNGSNKDSLDVAGKGKGANPFGEARPREEVLKEKGMDWKEIDEKLEAVRIHEAPPVERKGFGGPREDRTERAWRKPETAVERSFF